MTSVAPTAYVEVGGIDVSAYVRDLKVSRSINSTGGAEIRFDPRIDEVAALDLSSTIYLALLVRPSDHLPEDQQARRRKSNVRDDHDEVSMFTGTIEAAQLDNDEVLIRCFGGFGNLQDTHVSGISAQISNLEMVYTVLSIVGIPDEGIDIEGLAEIRARSKELFEVVVPIEGVTVQHRVQVGDAWFLPSSTKVHLTKGLQPLRTPDPFPRADCFAIAIVEHELLLGAEALGLEAIDTALAWVATETHDARLTVSGRLREFHRTDLLTYPERSTIVAVRGILTGRRWLRDTSHRAVRSTLQLASQGLAPFPVLVTRTLAESDKQALLAWHRAKGARDRLAAVLALWEAVEFYCASITVASPFSADELKLLKNAIKPVRSEVAPALASRVNDLLGKISEPPLLAKLRLAVEADRVPMAESDIRLLQEVRKLRNDAVHGRGPRRIPEEKVRRALSIVARMLVERVRNGTRQVR